MFRIRPIWPHRRNSEQQFGLERKFKPSGLDHFGCEKNFRPWPWGHNCLRCKNLFGHYEAIGPQSKNLEEGSLSYVRNTKMVVLAFLRRMHQSKVSFKRCLAHSLIYMKLWKQNPSLLFQESHDTAVVFRRLTAPSSIPWFHLPLQIISYV